MHERGAGRIVEFVQHRSGLVAVEATEEADLVRDEKGRWRLLVSAHYDDPAAPVPTGVLGVDLGIRSIAMDSDGKPYTGDTLLGLRAHFAHLRTKLQKKGTASARKLRRKRSKREHRFQKDVNHCIAKEIVQRAAASERAVALARGGRDRQSL